MLLGAGTLRCGVRDDGSSSGTDSRIGSGNTGTESGTWFGTLVTTFCCGDVLTGTIGSSGATYS